MDLFQFRLGELQKKKFANGKKPDPTLLYVHILMCSGPLLHF